MQRRRRTKILAALLSFVLLAGAPACSRSNKSSSGGGGGSGDTGSGSGAGSVDTSNCPPNSQTAGIQGDTINLVSSFPQSGLTAAFSQISKGYKSYFQYINDQGGVSVAGKKYKIKITDKDDQYNAAITAKNIDEEVGTDGTKAFAVFNVVGTSNNLAIRDSLNDNCVPNLFAATGSPAWGNPKYPWLIGSTLASYTLEAKVFADYLKKEKPEATVAMLAQDDDFGKAYEEGFKKAIQGSKIKVVQTKTYPVGAQDVGAQVTSLASTKADVFFDGGTLLACPDALKKAKAAGWTPLTYVSGTCISKTLMGLAGPDADKAFSVTNIKDPQNPQFKDDAAMKLYREQVGKYQPDADVANGIVAYGWTQGAIFVEALKTAKKLDRQSVMNAVRSMDKIKGGLLLDGVTISTSANSDPYMGETVQLIQYNAANKYFDSIGGLSSDEGKTKSLTPPALITG